MTSGHTTNLSGFAETGLVCAVLFFSGAAALVLELSWSRQIQLILGNTNYAQSIVLAGYFSGLGIGALLVQSPIMSRLVKNVRPLKAYAMAECFAAVWALAIPSILQFHLRHWQGALLTSACLVTILPATMALGTTLPFVARHFAIGKSTNSKLARAYGWNTFGAVCGLLAGISFLLVDIGVVRTGFVAAAVSAACGAVAWITSVAHPTVIEEAIEHSDQSLDASAGRSPRHPLVLAALSGFFVLVFEVLYLNLFSLVFHNSTYTFGIVLTVFLLALACGAWLQPALSKQSRPTLFIANCLGRAGVLTLLSVLIFIRLTGLNYFESNVGFIGYLISASMLVGVVVFLPVAILGMILPTVWSYESVADRTFKSVAQTTAVNSFAGAAGATVVSFLLLPKFGLWISISIVAVLMSSLATVLLSLSGERRLDKKQRTFAVTAPVAALTFAAVLSVPPGVERWANSNDEELVQRWNSSYGLVDVVRETSTGNLKVRQNLHYRHGSTGKHARQIRRMGHLPLLLHSEPRDVGFLGLGTGITASAAVVHKEIESIDIIELVPEVVSAAGLLAEANFDVINDRRTTIHIDDATHFLKSTEQHFDVLVADLFVPWECEAGYLYTVEHFKLARQSLHPNGLYCHWIPMYQVGAVEFELIANSFRSVFPNTTVWWGNLQANRAVVALIGSESTLTANADQIDQRLNELERTGRFDDAVIRFAPKLYSRLAGAWPKTDAAATNTNEHPRVEFLAPASHKNNALLQGETLIRYFDEKLIRLPKGAVKLEGLEDDLASQNKRRRLSRFLLLR